MHVSVKEVLSPLAAIGLGLAVGSRSGEMMAMAIGEVDTIAESLSRHPVVVFEVHEGGRRHDGRRGDQIKQRICFEID